VPWAFDALRYILEGGHRAHRQLIRDFVKRCPGRVLDCGSGTGIYAPEFASENYVGIDLAPEYVARARAAYSGYDFRVMDAARMDFPDESFDAAILSGVLHHLDGDMARRVLAELRRVLKPDGELLVWEDVPARNRWNLIGHVVHRLDVGTHIRESAGYRDLLLPYFHVEWISNFQSGFMDYGVFHCTKSTWDPSLPSDSEIMGTIPKDTDSSHDLQTSS
jgi:SAM-dependent methyltransferase